MNKSTLQESPDFSLVLGGPLYQLFRRARLSGNALELLQRRILAFWVITWLPLLCLSALGGYVLGDAVKIPFLRDLEAQVRFLVALPVLIAAELIVHLRIRPVVQRFVERGIVIPEELPRFHAAINSAMRVRNSVAVEVVLRFWSGRSGTGSGAARSLWALQAGMRRWKATRSHLTRRRVLVCLRQYSNFSVHPAALVSAAPHLVPVPVAGFEVEVRLTSTHPDRAGGLAFLGKSAYVFVPILFAQGALLAGLIAKRSCTRAKPAVLQDGSRRPGGFLRSVFSQAR